MTSQEFESFKEIILPFGVVGAVALPCLMAWFLIHFMDPKKHGIVKKPEADLNCS